MGSSLSGTAGSVIGNAVGGLSLPAPATSGLPYSNSVNSYPAQAAARPTPQTAAPTATTAPQVGFGGVPVNPMQQASQAQQMALAGTAANAMYNPMMVQAGQLSNTNLGAYQNPYTQGVIDTSMQDLERQRQMQQNQIGAQASAAGAFGGSRHGIAEAETNRAFAQQGAQMASGLRQQGFQNAQQMAQQDIASRMQAGLANQQAGLSGAQLGMQGAAQLGALGQQSFNYGNAIQQQIAQQGTQQQALQQALIDAAKGQYGAYTQFPAAGLSLMSQALGATPYGTSTTGSTQRQLGMMDYLTAGASLAAMSDKRLKTNIERVGELENGLGIYTWEWTEEAKEAGLDADYTKGVIAQEVDEVLPEAIVMGSDGYLRVDYSHPELKGAL